MHLPILIDAHNPHNRFGLVVPGHQHRTLADSGGVVSLAQHRPAEPLVVFGVEVGYQIDLWIQYPLGARVNAQLPTASQHMVACPFPASAGIQTGVQVSWPTGTRTGRSVLR